MTETGIDFDNPWKASLAKYFEAFMAFFFPDAHADVDWGRGYELLDKELQAVTRDAEIGRRHVDALVKLWCKDGEEAWVLAHVEIQSQQDSDFARRMFVYHYRIYDRHERAIASFGILGDEVRSWRPTQFGQELWGSRIEFQFPIVKLLDYQERWQELEASANPFSNVVMAHLKAQETRYDLSERKAWKLALTRRLYEKGYERQDILDLFRFIDWMLELPKDLESEFWQTIEQYETEKNMPYITSVERMGVEKGIETGSMQTRREDILAILETRFEVAAPQSIAESLEGIENLDVLKALFKQAIAVSSLEEFQALLVGDS